MKNKLKIIIVLMLSFVSITHAQYYSGISTSSSTFISDLETLIRNNYHKVSYGDYKLDMIPNYESYDNGDGTRSVIGVYSGFVQVYTPPFAWTPTTEMSREHTWCYSWMPTHGSTSTDEYSDRHHLFPVHQNNANLRRSNHPLGIVQTVTYQYLEGKLGTNSSGETVYEPRDSHKGDAARAILYMAVRYDGIDGNRWTFDWLNNTQLPSLSEAPQDLSTLIAWHKQDPPDKWEVERNDYIETLQNNRNPFVDHPEYINYIDFNDLSKLNPVYTAEPENTVTSFAASAGVNSITLTWTDAAAGSQAPSGYLIEAYSKDNYFIPIDGETYSDDTDLSDGVAVVNVLYSDDDSYTFNNLADSVNYYFTLFSYNGDGSVRNYDLEKSQANTQPASGTSSTFSSLIFTKYIEGSSNNKALEIFNGTGAAVNMASENYTIEIYYNGNSSPGTTISLVGEMTNISTYVIANSSAGSAITSVADSLTGSINFNGDDAIVLKKGGTVVDAIGQVGFDPGTEWGSGDTSTQDNTLHRKESVTSGDSNPNDAFDPSVEWNGYPKDDVSGLGESDPMPVELTTFTAKTDGDAVVLNWATATEVNNYGFEIVRLRSASQNFAETGWETIGFVPGHGNSNSPKVYSYVDKTAPVGKVSYRLKQMDNNGASEMSNIVSVNVKAPSSLILKQNYPNPFNPTTVIGYSIPKAGKVTMTVFNTIGQKVAELVNRNQEAGNYKVKFSAENLSSGIYFYKIQSGNLVSVKKMILLK